MAITSTGLNAATNAEYATATTFEDNSVLDKDDFLKLLLVQLQYQDPTEPTDTETILSQTSQLATLESAENTNKALAELTASLASTQEFSVISSIGKRADLGSDAIAHSGNESTTFEVYYPEDIAKGTISITDLEDNLIATIDIDVGDEDSLAAGVYQFTWDGLDSDGAAAQEGYYRVNSAYTDSEGNAQTTRLGAYPIESVRFENGEAYLKLGSNYVALSDIVEVY
jgi:flagellar basal-body rod modification protein FlgD